MKKCLVLEKMSNALPEQLEEALERFIEEPCGLNVIMTILSLGIQWLIGLVLRLWRVRQDSMPVGTPPASQVESPDTCHKLIVLEEENGEEEIRLRNQDGSSGSGRCSSESC